MASPAYKKRHEGCCSIDFLRYVLFIFNFFFLLAGIAVFGIGVWTWTYKHEYVSLLTTGTYEVVTYMLIIAGLIVIIMSAVGCFGVWREDRCALLIYTIFLIFIFLMEVIAGLIAFIYESQVETELAEELPSMFQLNYMIDPDKTKDIDKMQTNFKCCGAVSFDEWKSSQWLTQARGANKTNNLVPDTCCKTLQANCGVSHHPSNIHDQGCYRPFAKHLGNHLIILGSIGVGLSFVQIIGVLFSCCLYVKLREIEDLY